MTIKCAWINCKHNSFTITKEEVQKMIHSGIEILESYGKCNCDNEITLSNIEDEDTNDLVCDNFEDGAKFDF